MGTGDDRTFRMNFSGGGVAKLGEHLKEKLKEFMGDYTDDTLVEYVIALLKNGRCKEEARNELDVFLGDDSDSFVSWLWDHLGSNLNLYVQQRETLSDDVAACDHVKIDKSRPRHRRAWKGLMRDTDEHPPLRSVVVDISHTKVVKHKKLRHKKRSVSLQPEVQRKRSRQENHSTVKREVISRATIAAPRRLLQFAVRDAVATSRECLHRKHSIARVPNAMLTAIRAAKDVTKVRPLTNVFDRLGCATNVMDPTAQLEELREGIAEDMEDETFVDVMEVPPTHHQRNDGGQYARKLHVNTGMAFDLGSNIEEDLVDYSVAKIADGMMTKALQNQDQPTSTPNASRKMTGSLIVNTWKSPQYQEARKALTIESFESTENSGAVVAKCDMPFMRKNNDPLTVENGSVKPSTGTGKESQKIQSVVPGLYSTGSPSEDTASRTIFVNNVHFAATKSSLSEHFNQFGEVLKVVILTDAATGLPKGSAYVEFMRKESADHALSLDGTSFMSRILEVVKNGSAPPEATPVMNWTRVVRGGPFAASRFGRIPFPQGIPSTYSVRSMQWKRVAKSTSSNAMPSIMTPRSMTYVRAEQKTY